jgi:PAS domain S-box-containing protein
VTTRPNPKVELGPVDASCALLLCDLQEPDNPIVYASDAFCELTGYATSEFLGKNCRFLQSPDSKVRPRSTRKYVDKEVIRKMRKAVEKNEEIQLEVVNFKKSGSKFVNLLTMIPVRWNSQDYRYSVGFQVEAD